MSEEPAVTPTDEGTLRQVRADLDELKGYVSAFGIERIKDGTWFDEFVRAMLHAYSAEAHQTGAGSPGPHDGATAQPERPTADALVEEAARLAALAGGTSGLVTGAVLSAAFATAGASLAAVPAVAATALAELLYTARLQVRLVYDLAALAGYPLDPDDPDDLYKIFALSYGVVFTQTHLLSKLDQEAPADRALVLRRAMLDEVDTDRRAGLLLLGPQIGRAFIGEALASNLVPVAGAAGWSYLVTRRVGSVAQFELRALRELRAAIDLLSTQLDDSPTTGAAVINALLLVITADGTYTAHEQEVFQGVVSRLHLPHAARTMLADVEPSEAATLRQILAEAQPPLRTALVAALLLVAAADGEVVVTEREQLYTLVETLGGAITAEELEAKAALFRRPAVPGDQVLNTARDVGKLMHRWGQATLGLLGRLRSPEPAT